MSTCSICKREEQEDWAPRWATNLERSREICFTCGHFIATAENAGESLIVAGGGMYVLGPDNPETPRSWKGHGGRKFTIQFLDGQEVVTHDLWFAGDIPEALRSMFPDNAEFI